MRCGILPQRFTETGFDQSGTNGVDTNIVTPPVLRHGAGQVDNGCLADAVNSDIRFGPQTADRTDIDNRATATLLQYGIGGLAQFEGAFQVDVDNFVESA